MMHLLNITGLFLYLVFRVVILPMLAVLYCLLLVVLVMQGCMKLSRQLRAPKLKPIAPLYRFVKFRLNLSK